MIVSFTTNVYNNSFSFSTSQCISTTLLPQLKKMMQAQIEAIGRGDPQHASLLSSRVALCSFTPKEIEVLKILGLQIDPSFEPHCIHIVLPFFLS